MVKFRYRLDIMVLFVNILFLKSIYSKMETLQRNQNEARHDEGLFASIFSRKMRVSNGGFSCIHIQNNLDYNPD